MKEGIEKVKSTASMVYAVFQQTADTRISNETDGIIPNDIFHPNSYLHDFDLIRHNVLGDGNCLLRAIGIAMFGNGDRHTELRRLAIFT